tara:strand:+ start:1762 stop:1998 length:237 start_codon:yes stop_codon:yes gene_type:complete
MIKYFCDSCNKEMFFHLEKCTPVEVNSDSVSTTHEYEQGFIVSYYDKMTDDRDYSHYCCGCSEENIGFVGSQIKGLHY